MGNRQSLLEEEEMENLLVSRPQLPLLCRVYLAASSTRRR
jgi:hypothetical protein